MNHTSPARPKAIFLMGPTASGKTRLAIALKQRLPVEIVSVDSALIYRGMDIGTAKPDAAELAAAPHRLLDILDPVQTYSAAEFCRDALNEMTDITSQGKIPLLVGGTMLYFKALLEGLSPLPAASPEIRAQLEQQISAQGIGSLHQQLQQIDPVAAKRIHPHDPQRLLRALEVFLISGKTLTELSRTKAGALAYDVTQFAIVSDNRQQLHQRIEQRFHKMLNLGFEDEVNALYRRGDLHPNLPSVRCVGYRQMWSYLAKEIDYDAMVFQGISATRQLAKRQITWLRGWPNLHWLESEKISQSIDMIENKMGT